MCIVIKLMTHAILAGTLAGFLPMSASAQARLAVSGVEQTVDDYAQDWRRARKMARACGAPQAYMSFVSYSEGRLVAAKYEQQRLLGRAVKDSPERYSLGFQDDLDVNPHACARHRAGFAPIIETLAQAFMTGAGEVALVLPPTVAYPARAGRS